MVKGHLHKLVAPWMAEFEDLRERFAERWRQGMPGLRQLVCIMALHPSHSAASMFLPCLAPAALMQQPEAWRAWAICHY